MVSLAVDCPRLRFIIARPYRDEHNRPILDLRGTCQVSHLRSLQPPFTASVSLRRVERTPLGTTLVFSAVLLLLLISLLTPFSSTSWNCSYEPSDAKGNQDTEKCFGMV